MAIMSFFTSLSPDISDYPILYPTVSCQKISRIDNIYPAVIVNY